MLEKETLKKIALNVVDNIDSGGSDYTEKEMGEILDTINRATNTKNKLSRYQASQYLGISTSTFDNRVRAGIYPKGRKEPGVSQKFWFKSDLC